MAINTRLANKGRGEPIGALIQQGNISSALAKGHAPELVVNGWAAMRTDELEARLAELQSKASLRADAEGEALHATREEHKAIDDAKDFIYRVRTFAPRLLRDAPVKGVDAKAFNAGRPIGRSTPVILKYLTEIRPAVVKLDHALKPFFNGAVASAELDLVKKALDHADRAQETAAMELPRETLAVYEVKGRVLELIEDLNAVARLAFKDEPEIKAKFNKDILLRGRTTRAPAPVPAPPPAPGPVMSVPPAG